MEKNLTELEMIRTNFSMILSVELYGSFLESRGGLAHNEKVNKKNDRKKLPQTRAFDAVDTRV